MQHPQNDDSSLVLTQSKGSQANHRSTKACGKFRANTCSCGEPVEDDGSGMNMNDVSLRASLSKLFLFSDTSASNHHQTHSN